MVHPPLEKKEDWGRSEVYSLKNGASSAFLAMHDDGEVVCEDVEAMHHDIPFRIIPVGDLHVRLQCHINSLYLSVDQSSGQVRGVGHEEPSTLWAAVGGEGEYSFCSNSSNTFLSVDGTDVRLSADNSTDHVWFVVEPTTVPPPRIAKYVIVLSV